MDQLPDELVLEIFALLNPPCYHIPPAPASSTFSRPFKLQGGRPLSDYNNSTLNFTKEELKLRRRTFLWSVPLVCKKMVFRLFSQPAILDFSRFKSCGSRTSLLAITRFDRACNHHHNTYNNNHNNNNTYNNKRRRDT